MSHCVGEMLLLSLLNIVVSSAVDIFWFDFTKCLSDLRSRSFKMFFPTTFLPRKWWFPTILPGFNSALDSSYPNFSSFIYLLSCFLCLMQANILTPLKQSNIFSTTTQDMSSDMAVKEMRSCSLHQWGFSNLFPAETYESLQ